MNSLLPWMVAVLSVSCFVTQAKGANTQWEIIFRAVSGNGHSAVPIWFGKTKGKRGVNCEIKSGCIPMEKYFDMADLMPKTHIRSALIDDWAQAGINKVKLALYKDGKEVAFAIFDAKGSNNENWFDRRRLIKSSWRDATNRSKYNVFSIYGTHGRRAFHINKKYGGCHIDAGWLTVVDKGPYCKWDRQLPFPQFLYAKQNRVTTWGKLAYGKADVMAIFIDAAEK